MDIQPLVTVNILSFNRKEELRNTLTKVYEQDYKNIEVIVVDNASSDGSPEMVAMEFPSVILIKLDKNIGIAGGNHGFEIAKGKYILVLDDDSYPEKEALGIAIKRIINTSNIGVIAFNIYNTSLNSYENDWSGNYVGNFTGCGVLFSKELINSIGGFEGLLFIYSNEIEFSMRVIDSNYRIYFERDAIVFHNYTPLTNKISRESKKDYYFLRNNLIILLLHFSFPQVFFRIFRIIIGRLVFAVISLKYEPNIKAILSFLALLPNIFKKRCILKKSTQEYYNNGGFAGGFFNNNSSSLIRPKWLKLKKELL